MYKTIVIGARGHTGAELLPLLHHHPKFELVAVNSLGERSNSSVVPSNGRLHIRTHDALWCIGSDAALPLAAPHRFF